MTEKARARQVIRNYVAPYVGIGVSFHGRRYRSAQERARMQFVTTRWFLVLRLPLVPLSTWLVSDRGARVNDFSPNLRNYVLNERLPLDWRQIARGWAVTALTIIGVVLFHAWWVR